MSWYLLKSQALRLEVREDLEKVGFEYFLPTYYEMVGEGKKKIRRERPLVLNYLFVNGLLDDIKGFCHVLPEYHLHVVYLKKHQFSDDPAEPMIIPDAEMQMFIRTVGAYSNSQVPYLKPSEVALEQGDYVRILGGQFDGIEGVLVSQQGCDGGKVLVSVSNILMVPTLRIEPQYLQIIRFGKDKKHLYKHIDSYVPRLRRAMEDPSSSNLIQVRIFTDRFRELKTDTPNSEAKILALLVASFSLLGAEEEVKVRKGRLRQLMQNNSSEKTKSFVDEFVSDIDSRVITRAEILARKRLEQKDDQLSKSQKRRSRRVLAFKEMIDQKHETDSADAETADSQQNEQVTQEADQRSLGERVRANNKWNKTPKSVKSHNQE